MLKQSVTLALSMMILGYLNVEAGLPMSVAIAGALLASGLAGAVSGEVLCARRDASGLRQLPVLEGLDHGRRQDAGQIRVLAQALGHAAPAGVPADVHHGCEGPVHSVGRRLQRRQHPFHALAHATPCPVSSCESPVTPNPSRCQDD